MNIDQIISVFDLALTITFWSVLGLLLIYFLVGLLRGWKQGTFRTVFMLIILVTLLALLPVWVNIIGNLNLAGFGMPSIQVTIRGTAVTVNPTTVFATAKELVQKILTDCFHVKSSVEAVSQFATAFAASAIRLVLVTVIAILTMGVGSILAFLFWHALFKHFIPKPKRKAKLRVISAFEEVLVAGLCMVLMIAPLSSIVNSFQGYVDSSKVPEKYETVQLYKRLSDTYEKSILNQAFFAWTRGNGKVSIDVQLGEFLAQTDLENTSANFITEIKALGAAGGGILSLLADTAIAGDISTSLMLSPVGFAGHTLAALLTLSGEEGTQVLSDLSAFAGDISSRYDQVASTLGKETIKRLANPKKDVSYIQASEEAYRQLASAGVFETEVDPLVSLSALPVNDDPYLALTSPSTLEALESVSASPSESAVIEAVLHGYLSSRAKATGIKALMPESDNEFVTYPYLSEAKTIVTTFNHLNEMEPGLTKKLLRGPHYAETPEIVNDALAAFAQHGEAMLELIIGPRDAQGEPVVNSKGISAQGCLLDSGLINALFPAALEIGTSFLDENLLENSGKLDISAVAIELQGKSTVENIVNDKREFGRILDTVGKMMQNPYAGSSDPAKVEQGKAIAQAAKDLISNFKAHKGIELDPEGNLYSYETTLFQAIAYGISQIDSSKVFSALMPPVAEHMLLKADALSQFDITTLDPSPTDSQGKSILGQELAHFLAIGFRCPNVLPIFLRMGTYSVNSIATAVTAHADEFEKILDIVSDSKILNPDFRSTESGYVLADSSSEGTVIHNLNFVKVLNYLFNAFQIRNVLPDDALTDSSVVRMTNGYAPADSVVDYLSEKTQNNENAALIGAISTVMDSGVLAVLEDMASSQKIIQNLSDVNIVDIFSAIGDSFVLRRVVPGYFDDVMLKPIFSPDGGSSTDLDKYHISFTNIADTKEGWTNEGEYFQILISLASKGIDLANFDLFADGEALMEIMSVLSQSKMFAPYVVDESGAIVLDGEGNPTRDYVFPSFFSDKLLSSAGESIHYFENKDATPSMEQEEACSSFIAACKSLDTPEKWEIASGGEFAKLKDVFFDLSKIGSFDNLSSFDAETIPLLKKVLRDIAATDTFSTVFLGNALDEAMSKLDSGDLNFSSAYTAYFYDENRSTPGYNRAAKATEMQGQVDELFNIMEIIYDGDYGIANGTGIDMSSVNLKTISTEYFIDPLLTSAHASAVFHPTEAMIGHDAYLAYKAAHPYTLFEQLMGQFVMKSGVYSLNSTATWESPLNESGYHSDKSVASIVTGIEDNEWNNEIDALCDIVKSLQSEDLIDSSGNIDFSKVSDINAFFGDTENKKNSRSAWLIAFLDDIDSSSLLRRALPKILSDTINGISIDNVDIANDIKCANFYFMNSAGTDYEKLGHEEITTLVGIFKELTACTKMDPTDVSTLDGGALSNALNLMEKSKIFHSDVSKAAEVFASDPSSPKIGHTAFQNLLGDILANKALTSYLYYASNPKDIFYSGTYSDAFTKALFLIDQNCSTPIGSPTPNGLSGEVEINRLGEFLNALGGDALKPFMSGGEPSFDDMDTATLASLLSQMNQSAFLCDVVPSALDQTVSAAAGVFSIDGVDLHAADFYYMYDESTSPTPEERYKARYEQTEIDQICFIMEALKENKDAMSDLKISSIDPMMLRFLFLDLSNSKVFHLGGLPSSTIYPSHGWSYDGTLTEANDLTVFEQFVEKVYIESGLYTQNYDLTQSEADLQLYLDDTGRLSFLSGSGIGHDDRVKVAARYKLHQNILAFDKAQEAVTDETRFPVLKGKPINTSWLDEISALTTDGHYHDPKLIDKPGEEQQKDAYIGLIQVIQNSSFVSGDSAVSFSADILNKTEPNQIYYLFSALNHCTVINEALPNAFGSFVSGKGGSGGVGLNAYSNDVFKVAGPVSYVDFDANALASKTIYQEEELSRPAMAEKVTLTYAYGGSRSASEVAANFADHFQITYKGSDVTSLVSASAFGSKIILNVAKIPGSFKVTALQEGTLSGIEITYDRADYRLNQQEYENTVIPSVYYFFASMFRGPVDTSIVDYYYSFGSGTTDLNAFINDPQAASGFRHSTFGLFYIFNGSGIFNNLNKLAGDGIFAAKDFALFNLLDVKTDSIPDLSAYGVAIDPEIKMGAEFHPTLGQNDVYESSAGLHNITKNYTTDVAVRDFCFKEAAYIDQYVDALGYADVVVNKVYWDVVYSGVSGQIMAMNALENLSYQYDENPIPGGGKMPYNYMQDFASSGHYATPYQITLYGTEDKAANFTSVSEAYSEPGEMTNKLISSIVRKLAIAYNRVAKLNHSLYALIPGSVYPGTMASGRTAHMSESGYADLDAISSAFTHESALERIDGKVSALEAVGLTVEALYSVANNNAARLSAAIASFANITDGAKLFLEQFYMGDLYDYLAGGFTSSLTKKFNADNVYYDFVNDVNKLGGATDKAFSYADIATYLAPAP